MIRAMPSVARANPVRTMVLGRRLPAFRPASKATPNMLRERGASDSPASSALYSNVICRKIGSAIMAPPNVICCNSCPETPTVKCGNRNRPGSSSVVFPSRLRRTSHHAGTARAMAPIAIVKPT